MTGIVLVTGAGCGIGAAIARRAGARGFAVAVDYAHSADGTNRVVEEAKTSGGRIAAFKADMTSESEIVGLFAAIDRALGPVIHLVNNAGIIGERTAATELGTAAIDRLLPTNVTGPFLCAREVAKRMWLSAGARRSLGRIRNLGRCAAASADFRPPLRMLTMPLLNRAVPLRAGGRPAHSQREDIKWAGCDMCCLSRASALPLLLRQQARRTPA
jgi:NAD(P)-dependent dehydrogenase (short-subunit alcohol dehydrogenase family)